MPLTRRTQRNLNNFPATRTSIQSEEISECQPFSFDRASKVIKRIPALWLISGPLILYYYPPGARTGQSSPVSYPGCQKVNALVSQGNTVELDWVIDILSCKWTPLARQRLAEGIQLNTHTMEAID
jgi:hypothetical protein